MLHSWYEDWDDVSCCEAQFRTISLNAPPSADGSTILAKRPGWQQFAGANAYLKMESRYGRIQWESSGTKIVHGMKGSVLT